MKISQLVLLLVVSQSCTHAFISPTDTPRLITTTDRYLRVNLKGMDTEERDISGKFTRLFNPKARPPKIPEKFKVADLKIIEEAKIKAWRKHDKSVDEVFTLLKLDNAGKSLFSNPNFKTWLRYVDQTVQVQTKAAMIATLTAKYGDEGLAKLFQAAKNVPESEAVATKLQTEQMWVWLTNGNSIDAVLKLLKLDDGVDKVFMNPSLKSWEDYIQFYNKFMDEKPTTTIDSLMKFYGDETVAKMLEAATKAPNTRKIATDLQTAQFTQWLREGAKPAQIWKLLNMNKQTWMTNPDAQVFYKYVEFYKLHK